MYLLPLQRSLRLSQLIDIWGAVNASETLRQWSCPMWKCYYWEKTKFTSSRRRDRKVNWLAVTMHNRALQRCAGLACSKHLTCILCIPLFASLRDVCYVSNVCFFLCLFKDIDEREVMQWSNLAEWDNIRERVDDILEAAGRQVLPCFSLRIDLNARILLWLIDYFSVITKFLFAMSARAVFIYSIKTGPKLDQKRKTESGNSTMSLLSNAYFAISKFIITGLHCTCRYVGRCYVHLVGFYFVWGANERKLDFKIRPSFTERKFSWN